jgi:Bacterial extracellular solute-binding proteins, family 5 Middle
LLRQLAAISVTVGVLFAALPAGSARRPRYGGTLRVEMGAVVTSLDPSLAATNPEEAAAKEQIDALIFERSKSNGGWELSGPFRISEWQPGKFLSLVANNDYRDGRPFVDEIEIQMGRAARDRLVDLELNKIDFAEIPPEQARRAAERSIRLSASQPDELLAFVFVAGGTVAEDARVREAIARLVDRSSIVNFILQKEGEAAGGLLPQWSSGTAFLFPTAGGASGAKELWQQITPSPKIVLGYDSGDSLEQNVAERIAVNAREAGISLVAQAMQKSPAVDGSLAGASGAAKIDARLIRWPMPSPHPRDALINLQEVLHDFGVADPGPLPERASANEIYDRERMILNWYRIVPLVWLPHVCGLSSRVRDWQAPGPGQSWALADVWLEGEAQ